MDSDKGNMMFWLIIGIINFLAFAYDIENDRDFMTWMWLLTSQLNLMNALIYGIKYHTKK
jgi:hypothetical protein